MRKRKFRPKTKWPRYWALIKYYTPVRKSHWWKRRNDVDWVLVRCKASWSAADRAAERMAPGHDTLLTSFFPDEDKTLAKYQKMWNSRWDNPKRPLNIFIKFLKNLLQ